ncbi:MAG: phosphatase PAP2 family protein, partial [Deltaproteobacteria bacterium]|nr:phosphatase PAP2 family protein [Deltaproteobacteria bacterium]
LDVLKKLVAAFYLNFLIHYPIFFFFPTVIERPTTSLDGWAGSAFSFLRWIDQPVNCFPSQHVSLCFVVALGFWNYRRWISIFFLFWAIAISLSTLTTKQHYFWDVLGGLVVFLICYGVVLRKESQPKLQLVSPSK